MSKRVHPNSYLAKFLRNPGNVSPSTWRKLVSSLDAGWHPRVKAQGNPSTPSKGPGVGRVKTSSLSIPRKLAEAAPAFDWQRRAREQREDGIIFILLTNAGEVNENQLISQVAEVKARGEASQILVNGLMDRALLWHGNDQLDSNSLIMMSRALRANGLFVDGTSKFTLPISIPVSRFIEDEAIDHRARKVYGPEVAAPTCKNRASSLATAVEVGRTNAAKSRNQLTINDLLLKARSMDFIELSQLIAHNRSLVVGWDVTGIITKAFSMIDSESFTAADFVNLSQALRDNGLFASSDCDFVRSNWDKRGLIGEEAFYHLEGIVA